MGEYKFKFSCSNCDVVMTAVAFNINDAKAKLEAQGQIVDYGDFKLCSSCTFLQAPKIKTACPTHLQSILTADTQAATFASLMRADIAKAVIHKDAVWPPEVTDLQIARLLNCAVMEGDWVSVGNYAMELESREVSKAICREAALHPITEPKQGELL